MIKKNLAMFKIITILILIVILLKLCLVFLWPFIISIILVFALEPFVKVFKNIGLSRKISVFRIYNYGNYISGIFLLHWKLCI
jgi:predicted PurR-regulated permease PerM